MTSCVARCRRAAGRLERDQRAHAVADERRRADTGRVEQGEQPVGDRLDARQRRPVAAAVAGQVGGEHGVAVVREPARQQRPDAVVVQRAVDEDDARQARVERLAAGVRVGLARALRQATSSFIGRAAPRAAALSARLRSSIRSSASSRPIERRIVPGPMPARASAASSIRKCVVEAGMDDERAAVADVGEVREELQRLDEGAAFARASRFRSKLNTEPQPRGRSRLASAWSGCDSSSG